MKALLAALLFATMNSSGEILIETPTREAMHGTITIHMGEGTIRSEMTGRWLGASCAGADSR
jgi:hypothetical protein